jgi:hypothetical protein
VKPPPLYTRFAAPRSRRLRLGRWEWAVTDGIGGPVLASGHTLTWYGTSRRLDRAMRSCRPRPHHITRDDRPARHPLSAVEAVAICDDLAAEGIRIVIRLGDCVDVTPCGPVDTWQRVHAVRTVVDRTDVRVRWRAAGAR